MGRDRGREGAPCPDEIIDPQCLERMLLDAVAGALRSRDLGDVGSRATGRQAAPLSAEQVLALDPQAVAEWVVGRYPWWSYPAVVIGSPHAAAGHLAAALGVPWLPASFPLTVRWPGGHPTDPAGALGLGAHLAQSVFSRHRDIAIRQVHDLAAPDDAPSSIDLVVSWRSAPAAYRRFLDGCLAQGGVLLLVRDDGRWPVLGAGSRYTFQLGRRQRGQDPLTMADLCRVLHRVWHWSPIVTGWERGADLCGDGYVETGVEPALVDSLARWAMTTGRRSRQVLYHRPEDLSATVADVYRRWLRTAGKTGNRLIVECGRLVDVWQVIQAGLVPYWCADPLRASAAALEWWLAGSQPYAQIEVLIDPPGRPSAAVAQISQWLAAAAFATRRGAVDSLCARQHPRGSVAPAHGTTTLRAHPRDLPAPPPLDAELAIASLATAADQGLVSFAPI